MRLIIYADCSIQKSERVFCQIQPLADLHPGREYYQKLACLVSALKKPFSRTESDMALLILQSHEELEEILLQQNLLLEFKKLVVTPDNSNQTLLKAQLLYPRFFTSIDAELDELKAVFAKMLWHGMKQQQETGQNLYSAPGSAR